NQLDYLRQTRDLYLADKNNIDYQYAYSVRLHKERKYQDALSMYTDILEKSPNYLPARLGRGAVWQQFGRSELAVSDYNQVIQAPRFEDVVELTNKQAILIYHVLSADRFRQGQFEEAIDLALHGLKHA